MSSTPKRMVRKQLNIEGEQDEILKRLARDLGTSESEVVRTAIEHLARDMQQRAEREERARETLDVLFAEWDEAPFDLPEGGYRFGAQNR